MIVCLYWKRKRKRNTYVYIPSMIIFGPYHLIIYSIRTSGHVFLSHGTNLREELTPDAERSLFPPLEQVWFSTQSCGFILNIKLTFY